MASVEEEKADFSFRVSKLLAERKKNGDIGFVDLNELGVLSLLLLLIDSTKF